MCYTKSNHILKGKVMNRSDIMRISALLEIAMGSASLIAARFWVGTSNIIGRHVSHGDTTEAFALTYAFALLQITVGIIGVMNAEKSSISTLIFGILAFFPQLAHFFHIKGSILLILINIIALAVPVLYTLTAYKLFRQKEKALSGTF